MAIRRTEDMVPADKRLYSMRDVTATVPSINLITASVLSKKLAEGLDALVLDVKYGSAAFMKTREDAQKLTNGMEELGNACGVKVEAFLNDMDTPRGRTAGNWLEVVEPVECLENRGPEDVRDLVLQCAGRLLVLTGQEPDLDAGLAKAKACPESGVPRTKWDELLEAQGGDPNAFEQKLKSPIQAFALSITASDLGTISSLNAHIIGEVVRDLGGVRANKDSILDLNVGIADMKKPGERVEKSETLCVLYARNEVEGSANAEHTRSAWIIGQSERYCRELVQCMKLDGK
ncbi:hypothetical protein N0V90_004743 [Kalmusia sp. IMI 367209]|nr:hypothetical protein N0V90_004743 [Kalmusia sp. IMI 367209]